MKQTIGTFISENVFFIAIGFCLLVEPILGFVQAVSQSSVGAVKQYFGVKKLHQSSWIYYEDRVTRVQGTFDHTNYLGNWLVMLMPFLQTRMMDSQQRFRLTYLLWWLFCLLVLVLTFSRANWMAFLVGGAMVVYLEHRYRNSWIGWQRRLAYVMFPLIFGVTGYTLFSEKVEYYADMMLARAGLAFADKSYDIRSELVEGAITVIKGNLAVGVGLGNSNATIWQSNPLIPKRFRATVHNIYLIITTESGILGGVLFLIIILWPFFHMRKVLRLVRPGTSREVLDNAIGFVGGFAGLYFAMLWYVGMLIESEFPLIMTLVGAALGISGRILHQPRTVEDKAHTNNGVAKKMILAEAAT